MHKFSAEHGLQPNPGKSEIMCFGKASRSLENLSGNWHIGGQMIEVVTEHRDLGFYISSTQKWSISCTNQLLAVAKRKYFAMTRRCKEIGMLSPKLLCQMFDSLIRFSLTYGCEIWGLDIDLLDYNKAGKVRNHIEKVQLSLLKWILGVNKSTAGSIVRGEFGRQPLTHFVWTSVLKHWLRLHCSEEKRLLKQAFYVSLYLA